MTANEEPRPLFRPEALRRHARQTGQPRLALPPTLPVLACLLLGVLIGGGAFLHVGQYARKETVAGYVAPVSGSVEVHPFRAGVVTAVFVQQGARVAVGEPLFELHDPTSLTGGNRVMHGIGLHLAGQLAHTRAERASIDRLYRQRLLRLDHDYETTRAALARAAVTHALMEERQASLIHSLAARRTLAATGAWPPDQLHQAERDLITQRIESGRARAERRQLAARLPALRLQYGELLAERNRLRAELDGRLDALGAQLIETEARTAHRALAPVDGIVALLQIAPGQSTVAGKPALVLTPATDRLVVRLLIPSRAIGFVRPAQPVRLMYDAFPHQQFGMQAGTVQSVSATAVSGAELHAPIAPAEPVYVAIVELAQQSVHAFGQRHPVQAGMTVRADIMLAERRLIDWLLEPLRRVRG